MAAGVVFGGRIASGILHRATRDHCRIRPDEADSISGPVARHHRVQTLQRRVRRACDLAGAPLARGGTPQRRSVLPGVQRYPQPGVHVSCAHRASGGSGGFRGVQRRRVERSANRAGVDGLPAPADGLVRFEVDPLLLFARQSRNTRRLRPTTQGVPGPAGRTVLHRHDVRRRAGAVPRHGRRQARYKRGIQRSGRFRFVHRRGVGLAPTRDCRRGIPSGDLAPGGDAHPAGLAQRGVQAVARRAPRAGTVRSPLRRRRDQRGHQRAHPYPRRHRALSGQESRLSMAGVHRRRAVDGQGDGLSSRRRRDDAQDRAFCQRWQRRRRATLDQVKARVPAHSTAIRTQSLTPPSVLQTIWCVPRSSGQNRGSSDTRPPDGPVVDEPMQGIARAVAGGVEREPLGIDFEVRHPAVRAVRARASRMRTESAGSAGAGAARTRSGTTPPTEARPASSAARDAQGRVSCRDTFAMAQSSIRCSQCGPGAQPLSAHTVRGTIPAGRANHGPWLSGYSRRSKSHAMGVAILRPTRSSEADPSGVAHPDANHDVRIPRHRPGVAQTRGGARLPRHRRQAHVGGMSGRVHRALLAAQHVADQPAGFGRKNRLRRRRRPADSTNRAGAQAPPRARQA